ncbi:hypothetical protein COCSADRAFT_310705 [Bipolaris sorokiniana ND90Pr]|uniref:Uncharacterized protein n=1 Tax=Cochliobolus sativus (strain ND90Pr / ATCC 201652) TaxID=665912 RepID=M2SUB9_COCSN|nr:uncharacterized protein COCSADRAFT_310705 [Bipolaris sorokiniana ND90Pr]EMD65895.1 hypothetical protein COCSADRAFT_310705 [Bipolaris sorokiniana ND90Pr]
MSSPTPYPPSTQASPPNDLHQLPDPLKVLSPVHNESTANTTPYSLARLLIGKSELKTMLRSLKRPPDKKFIHEIYDA